MLRQRRGQSLRTEDGNAKISKTSVAEQGDHHMGFSCLRNRGPMLCQRKRQPQRTEDGNAKISKTSVAEQGDISCAEDVHVFEVQCFA